jgi:hypothetical protein
MKMTPPERAALTRVRAYLVALEEEDACAIIGARSLRPTLRSHRQKTRLHKFNVALREAITGRPV